MKKLEYDRELKKDELKIIKECNEILRSFNLFCDYYYIFENNLNDLEKFFKKYESIEIKIYSAIMMSNIIVEANKLMINFAVAFRNYLVHYEIKIKEIAGENTKAFGLQIFDTYNIMFTKEQKEKYNFFSKT